MGAWVMAGVTFREALRKKTLWMVLLAGAAFLALFGTGLHYSVRDMRRHSANPLEFQMAVSTMLMMGLYAVNFMVVAITVLTSVDTLSGEIASGTIHAVVTKPVSRLQVFAGKWLGFAGMVTLYTALMVGGTMGVTYLMSGYRVRHAGRGLGLMLLEALLLLTVTFLASTTFSTLTSGVIALGLHGLAFVGGWVETIAVVAHSPRTANIGILASVIMPSESMWRRAAYEMQSPLASATGFTPFSALSVPSGVMIAYAGFLLLLMLAAGMQRFAQRDL
jgi:ABC-2 type transport system permease protein